MAADTAFAQRFMLKYKWSALRNVTLETRLVLAKQLGSAADNLLRKTCAAAFDCAPAVRIVAIRAAHFAFEYGMMVRQLKLCADFQVALETSFRRPARIDDLAFFAAGGDVQTSRSVTSFAAHLFRVVAWRFQTRVRRGAKISSNVFVARFASLRADEFGAWNARRREDGAI